MLIIRICAAMCNILRFFIVHGIVHFLFYRLYVVEYKGEIIIASRQNALTNYQIWLC